MDVSEIVTGHYGRLDLTAAILGALTERGVDVEALRPQDLTGLDQLHAGFAPATQYVLDSLDAGPGVRLLDVGSGIGGPARMAAAAGAHVTGVDLTPAFVETASALTARVGLSDRATFQVAPGDVLPCPDACFDAAMMIHVGMNVPDKQALFAEVRRALVHGGRFAIYDQMRAEDGELPWPLPWADDERSSFVERPEEYAGHLAAAGFTVDSIEDRTKAVAGPPPGGGPGNATVLGPDFLARIGNNVAAGNAGLLAAVLVVAVAT